VNPHGDASPSEPVWATVNCSDSREAPLHSGLGVPAPETGAGDVVLYTPGEAARLLSMPESWLRRKAGQRRIPCTMLGKHLRFSQADLARITTDGAQTIRQTRGRFRRP
jgi:excisionase family DNA binding protein